MTVSIIILQYGRSDYTCQCLKSLLAYGVPDVVNHIFLIDNHSDDLEPVRAIKSLSSVDSRIKVIINNKNLGFGVAHNEIIKQIKDDYILLLNNDTLIIDHSFSRFISTCARHKTKLATGVLLNEDLSIQQNTKGYFGFPAPIKRHFKSIQANTVQTRIVPCCNGALLWIDRRVFNEVDGFDPTFFMYNEDLDLMIKLNQKNYWVTQYLFCKIIHFGGTSAKARWNDTEKLKLQIRQGNQILRNHYSKKTLFFMDILYFLSNITNMFLALIKSDTVAIKKLLYINYWKLKL